MLIQNINSLLLLLNGDSFLHCIFDPTFKISDFYGKNFRVLLNWGGSCPPNPPIISATADTTLIITISDHATPSVRQRKLKEFQNQNGVTLIRRLLGRKRRHKSNTKSTKHKTRKSLTRALRSTYDNANVNNNILNLSQIKLSQSQISLLGRGLTFVNHPYLSKKHTMYNLYDMARLILLNSFKWKQTG